MITAISELWSLMTVFFTTEVLHCDLFFALILLFPVFYVVYLLFWFFDPDNWGIRV